MFFGKKGTGARLHRGEVREVALDELEELVTQDCWVLGDELLDCDVRFLFASGCQIDLLWVVLCELADCLATESNIA